MLGKHSHGQAGCELAGTLAGGDLAKLLKFKVRTTHTTALGPQCRHLGHAAQLPTALLTELDTEWH